MWAGIGRMVVVTDPGEHLVEVRGSLEADTVRLVRVKDGEIAELDYWIPASYGGAQGLLVPYPAPAWRRLGSGFTAMLMPFAGLTAIAFLVSRTGIRPDGFVFAAMMLSAVALTVAWVKGKGYADRRYRAAISSEATRPGQSAVTGMFLGDGAPPEGLAGGGDGLLVVTGALVRRYRWNGSRNPAKAAADPNGWAPWPARTVTVDAGRITRLDVRADTTVDVRSPSLDRAVPTVLTGLSTQLMV